jgi:hypothetical protein
VIAMPRPTKTTATPRPISSSVERPTESCELPLTGVGAGVSAG